MQKLRTADPTQSRLDRFQIGLHVAHGLGWLDEDSQTPVHEAFAQQELGGSGIPNASLHPDAALQKKSDELQGSIFVDVDGGKIWQSIPGSSE